MSNSKPGEPVNKRDLVEITDETNGPSENDYPVTDADNNEKLDEEPKESVKKSMDPEEDKPKAKEEDEVDDLRVIREDE